ncbi:hypothetical protein HOLDEFILI_03230 [Holdemania filiformis DSM 12042]|uniref:Uncharacterized protein n=1 Tax=Holdemania filiformis DSM 12042 TaxID=545696 RepID=B9YBM3_9FIRM|nr:hypothetical protein HOLDEFILI_03230 [Holdemania filiformis DSM 12042]
MPACKACAAAAVRYAAAKAEVISDNPSFNIWICLSLAFNDSCNVEIVFCHV